MNPSRVLLAAALLVAACGGTSEGGRPAMDRVRVVVLPYLSIMPLHIAAAEGYFEQQHLDVEFIHLGRQQEIMTALARGDVDAAAGMLTVNELNLAAAGERVRMVQSLSELDPDSCPFMAFVIRQDAVDAGALEDREQLRRLRADVDLLTPLGYWLDLLVRPYDLTIADMQIVNLPTPAASEAIRSGAIDLTIDAEPWVARHTETPEVVPWRSVAELTPGYVLSMVMYGPGLLEERRDVGNRFATAVLQASRQYMQGKTARNLEIVGEASGLGVERVNAVCWPYAPEDGRIVTAALRGYQEWSVARGYVDRVLEDEELVDQGFMDHANGALAAKR